MNQNLHHAGAGGDGVADESAPQVHVLRAPAQHHVLPVFIVVVVHGSIERSDQTIEQIPTASYSMFLYLYIYKYGDA